MSTNNNHKMKLRKRLSDGTDFPDESTNFMTTDRKRRHHASKVVTSKSNSKLTNSQVSNFVKQTSYSDSSSVMTTPSFASDLLSSLHHMYETKVCCDIVVVAGSVEISVHKVVLVAASGYLRTLLMASDSVPNNVIYLPPSINGECLKSMISYLYTGSLDLDVQNILLALTAATLLEISSAVDLCHQFLNEHEVDIKPDVTLDFIENSEIIDTLIKYENPEYDTASNSWSSSANLVAKVEKKKFASKLLNNSNSNNSNKSTSPKKAEVKKIDTKQVETKKSQQLKKITDLEDTQKRRSKLNYQLASRSLARFMLQRGNLCKCTSCNKQFRFQAGLTFHLKKCHNENSVHSNSLRLAKRIIRRWKKFNSIGCRVGICPAGGNALERYYCPVCNKKFAIRSRCLVHLRKEHCDSKPKIVLVIKRKRLKRSYKKRENNNKRICLRDAEAGSPKKVGRPRRADVYRSKQSSWKNNKVCKLIDGRKCRISKRWQCKQVDCGIILSCERDLRAHMSTDHPSVVFSCPHCRFTTQVEKIFQRHQVRRHRHKKICDLCGRTCHSVRALKQHMFIHHKIIDPDLKLFQCDKEGCDYACLSKKRMEDHAFKHNELKSYTCEDCGKLFKHKIGLDKHHNRVHEGIRPFICDQCGMTFGMEGELKTHAARHARSKPYSCDQCSYSTYDKCNLQSHLFSRHKMLTGSKMQVLKCEMCSFTTNRKGRFRDHLKSHQNVRDIPCPQCDKMFVSKKNLYGHVTSVHRPKTLRCSFCSYSTAITNALKKHVEIMHTHRDIKNYECPLCGFHSATSGNCRKHIQRTHLQYEVSPRFIGKRGGFSQEADMIVSGQGDGIGGMVGGVEIKVQNG